MNREILYRFLDSSYTDRNSLKVWYDFDDGYTSGEIIYNNIHPISGHYFQNYLLERSVPGLSIGQSENPATGIAGKFAYTDLVRAGNELDNPNWTVFLDFKSSNHCQNTSQATVLLSNKENPDDLNGFILGLTKSNRLSFEYYKNNISSTSKDNEILFDEIADGGVVSLSKNNTTFELIYHNWPQNQHSSISFNAGSDYADGTKWFLGGLFTGLGSSYEGLSGHYNNFLYFDTALNYNCTKSISQSFFLTGISPSYQSGVMVQRAGLSEIVYNPSGNLNTGISSYEYTPIDIDQQQGGDIQLYMHSGITGFIVGEVFEFVTGAPFLVETQVTIPESYLYDQNKLLQYSKSNFVYDGAQSDSDIFELYGFQTPSSSINIKCPYNPIYSSFILDNSSTNFTPNSNIIYLNGIYQESGYDYIASNNFLLDNSFTSSDTVSFDQIEGARSRFEYSYGSGGTYLITGWGGDDVYLNGQKLISGYSYTGSSTNLWLLDTETMATGIIQFVPRHPDISYISTGNGIDAFSDNSYVEEQIWLNGQRLALNDNFIRTNICSIRDKNTCRRYNNIIYNNTDDFINV